MTEETEALGGETRMGISGDGELAPAGAGGRRCGTNGIAVEMPQADAIPIELRQRRQWVAWTYKRDGGKLPLNPRTGKAAATDQSQTWTDFQTAYRYATAHHCGIGYVFSGNDPYCGADLDDCRSEHTGAIRAEVWPLIEALDSYTEVSPSGRGVKALVKAKLDRAHKGPGVELYDRGRFFCITGRRLQSTPATIEHRQSEVDTIIHERFGGNGHRGAEAIPEVILEGQRNNVLTSFGGTLRQRGAGLEVIEASLLAMNQAQCRPPLPDDEVRAIAASVSRYEPGQVCPSRLEAGRQWPQEEMTETTEPVLLSLADVTPKQVRWLWHRRIPLGKLTIMDGDPGVGKSLITIDLAGRVSTHDLMPDGTLSEIEGPAGVVLLCIEDDPADTIRPRLDAAGADCSRIVLLQEIRRTVAVGEKTETKTRQVTLADVDAIEAAIRKVDAKLVIVDPVMAYTGRADTHVDAEVRQVLSRLAKMAQDTGVAVLAVRHLNKSVGGNPLYRGGGSIGFIASARSGLLVAHDPDDSSGKRCVLASTKCNLAELPRSLAYEIEAPDGVARVAWRGESTFTASSLLAAPASGEEHSALSEAKDFLSNALAAGPVEVSEIKREARQAGISEITLRRAKEALGVSALHDGGSFGGGKQCWKWEMPPSERPSNLKMITGAQGAHSQDVSTFSEDDHVQRQDWPDAALFRPSDCVFVDTDDGYLGPHRPIATWVAADGRRMYQLDGLEGQWSQAQLEGAPLTGNA
ncbi:MAG: AAA family ATPase [Chloroflexi bacterium]|nr:AAA family ATPase [Chloroflexota bacterium]